MSDIHYGRKRKGIRMQLDSVLNRWLDTIDNIDVQTMARKDVIVTGGSIASMLLGEKVNDYDMYFRTYETTLAVARYYVDKFNKAKTLKVTNGVNPYMPIVKEQVRKNCKGGMEKRVVLWMQSAGVAAEEQDQYSYFETMGEDAATKFFESTATEMKAVESENDMHRPVFMSENAITLSHGVQLVTRFYGEPTQIHDNYDFVHATCYYDLNKKELVFPAEALEALLSRTLVYRGSLYPIASIFRTKKFIERGWRITAGQQLKIMWQISELNLKDPDVLREQLTGVDMAYMWQLIQALQDIDPNKITSTYVGELIERIFE